MLEEVPVSSPQELEEFVATLSCEELEKMFEEAKGLFKDKIEVLDPAGTIVFHGDLHGDIATVYSLWERLGLEEVLNHYKLVFLGDYVDRGPKQIEALLLVLALKARRPEEVIVLRGNHEPLRDVGVSPHDFPDVLYSRCGPKGIKLYEKALDLFDALPLMARVGDVIGLHGGPPTRAVLKGSLSLTKEDIVDVLWSDPDELVGERLCSWDEPAEKCFVENYLRGIGKLWGAGMTRAFLEMMNAKSLVRGHTNVDGFALCHKSRVLTLFTRSGPPYFNQRAAVGVLKEGKLDVIAIDALPFY